MNSETNGDSLDSVRHQNFGKAVHLRWSHFLALASHLRVLRLSPQYPIAQVAFQTLPSLGQLFLG